MPSGTDTTSATKPRHSWVILAALGGLLVYQVLGVTSIATLLKRPSGGWILWETWDGQLAAQPATPSAMAVASRHAGPLLLQEVNGRPVAGEPLDRAAAAVDASEGAQNAYVLRGAGGQRVAVTLPVETPVPDAFGEEEAGGILSILYHLLGLGFLAIGLYHWWRRPADPAARALLLFCVVAAFHMAEIYPHDQLSRLLFGVNQLFLPLFAPAGLYLAVTFTRQQEVPLFRVAARVLLAGALVIGAALAAGTYHLHSGVDALETLRQGALAAAGLTLASSALLSFGACWQAARSPSSSLVQGVRARAMARALLVPFIVPSLWQALRPLVSSPELVVAIECVQLAALAAFPVMVGHAITFTDVIDRLHRTQNRLMDAEIQGMLTRFIAGIVHEVNSPLGVLTSGAGTIRSAVQILDGAAGGELGGAEGERERGARRRQRALEVCRETARTMEAAGERITSLLANLQRSISLDAAEYRALDLRDGLEDALRLLGPNLERRVTVTRSYPEGDEAVVSCYPARLNRVFISLLQNAVDAIGERGELSLSVQGRADEVRLEIADTGRGIPTEQLATLFDFGFTARTGRIGLGMGLPSSKLLVERMGGAIDVRSTEGQGTTVCLTLPRTCERDLSASVASA